MPDYQKMYTTLFNEVTDTIARLQEIQRQTEEMYLKEETPPPVDHAVKCDG
ncbi:MAG: hypothetical protein R3Y62_08620 [Eubacteriales bacterium]